MINIHVQGTVGGLILSDVYLGKKTSTEEARKHYFANKGNSNGALNHISEISEAIVEAKSLKLFE